MSLAILVLITKINQKKNTHVTAKREPRLRSVRDGLTNPWRIGTYRQGSRSARRLQGLMPEWKTLQTVHSTRRQAIVTTQICLVCTRSLGGGAILNMLPGERKLMCVVIGVQAITSQEKRRK